jgi:hypothetical protein
MPSTSGHLAHTQLVRAPTTCPETQKHVPEGDPNRNATLQRMWSWSPAWSCPEDRRDDVGSVLVVDDFCGFCRFWGRFWRQPLTRAQGSV